MTLHRDRIDPQLLPALEAFRAAGGPRPRNPPISPMEQRAQFSRIMAGRPKLPNPSTLVRDVAITGPGGALALRTYRPVESHGQLPVVLFIHGGGFIVGDLDSEHASALNLSRVLSCAVVSVDYRLAPEHPYPAAVEDCYATLKWITSGAEPDFDPTRVALYGGSAGGGLAAATSLTARDRGGPAICYQMLIYPMLDHRGDSASCQEIDDIGIFDAWDSSYSWHALLGSLSGDAVPGNASPALADDLRGLPATWIEVGEVDALRDEAITLAARLMQARVPTELHVYSGAYHGFDVFAPEADLVRRAIAARHDALLRAMRG